MTRRLVLLLVLALGGPPSSAPQPVPVATRIPAATPVDSWCWYSGPPRGAAGETLARACSNDLTGSSSRLRSNAGEEGRKTQASDHANAVPAPSLTGTASWVRASLGSAYLAMRLPKGTHVAVCGPLDCVRRTVNDYGPSRRLHPERIADLSRRDFAKVCGDPVALGVCDVTARVLGGITLPETDAP